MKIKDMGVVITDVSGIQNIIVEPDDTVDGGVHIVIGWQNGSRSDFSAEGLDEVIDALRCAYDAATDMIVQN